MTWRSSEGDQGIVLSVIKPHKSCGLLEGNVEPEPVGCDTVGDTGFCALAALLRLGHRGPSR